MTFAVVDRAAPRPDLPLGRNPNGTQRCTPEYLIAELRAWAESHDGRPPRYADWNRNHARRHGITFEEGWPSTQAVANHFGSWRKGIVAAGFTPRRPGRSPNPPEMYGCCANPACAVQLSAGHVEKGRCARCNGFRYRHGVEWTPDRQAHILARQRRGFLDRLEGMIELRNEGRSNIEIAAEMGIPYQSVGNAFSRARHLGIEVPRSPYYTSGACGANLREAHERWAAQR